MGIQRFPLTTSLQEVLAYPAISGSLGACLNSFEQHPIAEIREECLRCMEVHPVKTAERAQWAEECVTQLPLQDPFRIKVLSWYLKKATGEQIPRAIKFAIMLCETENSNIASKALTGRLIDEKPLELTKGQIAFIKRWLVETAQIFYFTAKQDGVRYTDAKWHQLKRAIKITLVRPELYDSDFIKFLQTILSAMKNSQIRPFNEEFFESDCRATFIARAIEKLNRKLINQS